MANVNNFGKIYLSKQSFVYNIVSMKAKEIYKCTAKEFRLAVAPLSKEDKELILKAKRQLGLTKPYFYRMAILEKARAVVGEGVSHDSYDN